MNSSNKVILSTAIGLGAIALSKAINRKFNQYNFSQKVVAITGGSRGLGLVMARQLAFEGARIAIIARDKEELIEAKEELQKITNEVIALPADLTDRTQVNKAFRSIRENLGNIDVLINNAGIIQVGPYNTMTLEDYEYAMSVHFWAPLYSILAVLPQMRENGAGRIVNISSIGGKISVPHLLPYSASKFALTGLSEGLRSELKKEGILVTTVCPGLIRTGSTRNIDVKGQHENEYTWFKLSDSIPLSSMGVETAAKKIIKACKYGDSELILTIPAKLATAFHGLFPGTTTDILANINHVMPDAGGKGALQSKKGFESETGITKSFFTSLDEDSAEKNNEI